MTEADIVNFACLSGNHFYAHMDKIAAAESISVSGWCMGILCFLRLRVCLSMPVLVQVIANYGWKACVYRKP
ncbi:MaoC/PaaZ C-terminal domain-containing protein [Escherichia coli]